MSDKILEIYENFAEALLTICKNDAVNITECYHDSDAFGDNCIQVIVADDRDSKYQRIFKEDVTWYFREQNIECTLFEHDGARDPQSLDNCMFYTIKLLNEDRFLNKMLE